jgi:hypothetical protein
VNDGRGGRENHGTLFYLRGNYYHDRWSRKLLVPALVHGQCYINECSFP